MKLATLIAAAACVTLGVGCSSIPASGRSGTWETQDPPEEFDEGTEAYAVPPSDIYIVPPAHVERAKDLLRYAAHVKLKTGEAASLLEKTAEPRPGLGFYLVRGIYQVHRPGEFMCVFDREWLSVFYGAVGSSFGELKNQPLIILLPAAPKKVYVTTATLK